MECAEEQGDVGEFGKDEHQAGCSVLDKLQGFDGTSWEPSQQRVAVVQAGDDKSKHLLYFPFAAHQQGLNTIQVTSTINTVGPRTLKKKKQSKISYAKMARTSVWNAFHRTLVLQHLATR